MILRHVARTVSCLGRCYGPHEALDPKGMGSHGKIAEGTIHSSFQDSYCGSREMALRG